MRLPLRRALWPGAIVGALFVTTTVRAADIAADGTLVFANDAIATYGFESFEALEASGASAIAWSKEGLLITTSLVRGDEVKMLTTDALEGSHALVLRHDLGVGVALRDPSLFSANVNHRLAVTFWGRSFGAEPTLELIYAHNTTNVGPGRFHVVAIRTGRETSDGWVEYGTGPVDGAIWGTPLRAIVLTARYATAQGSALLASSDLAPTSVPSVRILDPSAYAVVDAVEVSRVPGDTLPPATCTQATVDAACGARGECMFGRCVDSSLVWGPVPEPEEHRRDLVARWAFLAQSLHADRKATKAAASTFAGASATLEAVTTPRAFYGGLNALVSSFRDSHTHIGGPSSWESVFYPILDQTSGPLDVCFGVAENDLGASDQVFAIFATGKGSLIGDRLAKGDVLTAIDGEAPARWIENVLPRYAPTRPSDAAADPTFVALLLPTLLGRFARTVTFSRCKAGGGCDALPDIAVGAELYEKVRADGATGGYSLVCTPRFRPAVSAPPRDDAPGDPVALETVDGVANIQFDGFSGSFTVHGGFGAWQNPWKHAFAQTAKVLVDARIGHGGRFVLGRYLFGLMRGTDQPYGVFAMPRGGFDDPDPPWLFSPSWDACGASDGGADACNWAGGQTAFTQNAAPAGEAARVAWLIGNDVSMNDIVPRLMAGRAGFHVFGPHPTQGAYGEVSKVPPILTSWRVGAVQVLDMRFGATPATARAAPWESGKGVAPDTVVVQKVSDILRDEDTVLAAARAWVSQ
jgi:hypothetical protein